MLATIRKSEIDTLLYFYFNNEIHCFIFYFPLHGENAIIIICDIDYFYYKKVNLKKYKIWMIKQVLWNHIYIFLNEIKSY